MSRWSIAACVITGTMLLAAAPASARNYDCSKAGNANKAACKGAAVAVPKPAVKPAPAAAVKPAPVAAAKPAAVPAAARHYDCSKAGNATKAACRGATPVAPVVAARPAPAPAPRPMPVSHPQPVARPAAPAQPSGRIVAWTTKTRKGVHYDCSKAGNLNKQACKQ